MSRQGNGRRFNGSECRRSHGFGFLGLLAIVLLVGCGNEPPAARSVVPGNIAVSDEECQAFARSLEDAVQKGDGRALNNAVLWDAVIARASDSLELSSAVSAGFRKGMLDEINAGRGIGQEIVRTAGEDGSYKFLRIIDRDGQKGVLLRLFSDKGINYHEWLLTKEGDQVKASDLYFYLTGELVSDTVRRSVLPLAKEASKSFLEKLTASESEYVANLDEILQMTRAFQQQRFDEALRIYSRLPESLKADKNMLLIRYQSASSSGNEQQILAAAEDFRKHHPNDVCLDLLLIDYYALKNQPEKVMECLDRLDKAVGGDVFLNVMRANAIVQHGGDRAKALELAEKAVAGSPDMQSAHWTLVTLALAQKNHERTLAALNEIDDRFDLEWGDLRSTPDYADFVSSPQGEQWIKDHPPGSRSKATKAQSR